MNTFLKKQNLKLPLPQSKRGFGTAWQKVIIGAIGLILFIVVLNIFQSPIKNTFYALSSPLLNVFLGAGDSTKGFFYSFLRMSRLDNENNVLRQQNQQLLFQILSLQETIRANQAIQSAIQNTREDHFDMVLVEVLGFDSAGDFILVNKGYDDGITENMPVVSSTKVLFGKAYKVYKNFSQIMLISNKSSVVDTSIQQSDTTATPILGVIKGSGNLSLYLDLVQSEAKIKEGDTLVTSGLEGVFPKNLLVGKITSKEKDDLKPFQTASVQPFFNIQNSENLFIITNYLR